MALNQELDMTFNYVPVVYGTIKEGIKTISPKMAELFNYVQQGEKDFVKAWNRKNNVGKPEKRMLFNHIINYENEVLQTVAGNHGTMFDYEDKAGVSDKSMANGSTFPKDYDFCGQSVAYICGMSVPPLMIKRIVTRIIESGLFTYDK